MPPQCAGISEYRVAISLHIASAKYIYPNYIIMYNYTSQINTLELTTFYICALSKTVLSELANNPLKISTYKNSFLHASISVYT